MGTNAIDVFKGITSVSTVSRDILDGFLGPLVYKGNDTVDKDNFAEAKKILQSDSFQRKATFLAKEDAEKLKATLVAAGATVSIK